MAQTRWERSTLNMYKLTLTIIAAFLLLGCMATSKMTTSADNTPQSKAEGEDYAIYLSLLNKLYSNNSGTASVGIVEQTSLFSPPGGSLDKTLNFVRQQTSGQIPQEVIDDIKIKNRDSYKLDDHFNIGVKYVLLPKQEIQDLFSSGGTWAELNERYSINQVIVFSKIGFNRAKTQALVYTSTRSGPKTGYGLYVYLTKNNGVWTIKHQVEVWVS